MLHKALLHKAQQQTAQHTAHQSIATQSTTTNSTTHSTSKHCYTKHNNKQHNTQHIKALLHKAQQQTVQHTAHQSIATQSTTTNSTTHSTSKHCYTKHNNKQHNTQHIKALLHKAQQQTAHISEMQAMTRDQESFINKNIDYFRPLINVEEMRDVLPQSQISQSTILKGREDFIRILNGADDRFIVITGPCSIHDVKAAQAYAKKLKLLAEELRETMLIMMRVYFEKPRTILGWKGLINDPHLDDSFEIGEGLQIARRLLIDISNLGLTTATEILDPITAAYLAELVCWVAIGARTTESQIHREMVSGLSTPVGFKNSTLGDMDIALNAIQSAASAHSFLGTDDQGKVSVVRTRGNPHAHIVLRGGLNNPNYYSKEIIRAEEKLHAGKLPLRIMVDCSHDNSGKNHEKQKDVVEDIIKQKQEGNTSIFGIMLESHLSAGNQKFLPGTGIENLKYGVSITDTCIGWEETEVLLRKIHNSLQSVQQLSPVSH